MFWEADILALVVVGQTAISVYSTTMSAKAEDLH
jgi:hypothetical protein